MTCAVRNLVEHMQQRARSALRDARQKQDSEATKLLERLDNVADSVLRRTINGRLDTNFAEPFFRAHGDVIKCRPELEPAIKALPFLETR